LLPNHLQPWAALLKDNWPADAGPMPDRSAVAMALRWVKAGEVSGLAIVMYCRPDGATNREVAAACGQPKTNRAGGLQKNGELDFYSGYRQDGSLAHYVGPWGTRRGPPDGVPFPGKPLRDRAPPDLTSQENVARWLAGKPRQVAVVFAARAASRVIPVLASTFGLHGRAVNKDQSDTVLRVFRCAASAWAAGLRP
jgi:hypothetical protein